MQLFIYNGSFPKLNEPQIKTSKSIMKRAVFFLLSMFVIVGCQAKLDNVVDPQADVVNYQLRSITMPDTFIYSTDIPHVKIQLEFTNGENIEFVKYNLSDPNNESVENNVKLYDDGSLNNGDSVDADGKFSGLREFSLSDINGNYNFNFSVTDLTGETKDIAVRRLTYFNAQPQFAPIISDLIIPDSVNRNKSFVFSVKANDENGLGDIKKVYFELYRPDGSVVYFNSSTQDTQFPMYDNGDLDGSGDETMGDGIYSLKNSFGPTSATGLWKFDFRAIDNTDSLSNLITHQIEVL